MLTVSSVRESLSSGKRPDTKSNTTDTEQLPKRQKSSSSLATGFIGKAIAALAMLAPLGVMNPEAADAANNPAREKAVSNFAEESWSTLKDALDKGQDLEKMPNSNILWNNLRAVLNVTDDTMVEAVDHIRTEIINKGATDPNIPASMVHNAIYTNAVVTTRINEELTKITNAKELQNSAAELEKLNQEASLCLKSGKKLSSEFLAKRASLEEKLVAKAAEITTLDLRRKAISQGLTPYLGKVIVDVTRNSKKERHLVTPSEIDSLKGEGIAIKVYDGKDFNKLAAFAIAQVADQNVINEVAKEILASGNNTERRNQFLDVLIQARPDFSLSKDLQGQLREWVFGPAQIKAFQKGKPISTTSDDETSMLTIPNIPSNTKVGTLEELKKLDPKLVTPLLSYPFGQDKSTQKFIADNILLLAKHGDELALPAAAQWFAEKHYSDGAKMQVNSDADFQALQALAILAQKDDLAFKVLERVAASLPDIFADAFFKGTSWLENEPARQAGVEIIKAFNSKADKAKELIKKIADKKAPLIWTKPLSSEDINSVNSIKDNGRTAALIIMAFIDDSQSFTPYLREMVKSPFTLRHERGWAMSGVARVKDKASVDALLDIGVNKVNDTFLRDMALYSVLRINRPDPVPKAIRDKASQESPFTQANLKHYFPQLVEKTQGGKATSILQTLQAMGGKNIFRERIVFLYKQQLDRIEKQGQKLSNEDKIKLFNQICKEETGGAVLAGKADDPTFNAKYIQAMISELKEHADRNKPLNPWIAMDMIDILGTSNAKEAKDVLADIAITPEHYVLDLSKDISDLFDLLFSNWDTSDIKEAAIRNLGGVVGLDNFNDPATQIIHRVARKDSSRMYRDAAQMALNTLADRYDSTLSKMPDGDKKAALLKARDAHAKETIGHMQYHSQGLESRSQMRLAWLWQEFSWAQTIDKLGGTKDLLTLASEASKTNPNAPIVRSVVHALVSNGKKLEDIKKLGFDEPTTKTLEALFTKIDKQEFWLGPAQSQKYTGKGVEVAVLDGGYVYPVEGLPGLEKLKDRIIYPEKLIRWSDLTDWLDLHPTAVASTVHKLAPDSTIRTYSFQASIPEVPFRPFETQDPAMRALEDMAEQEIAGTANVASVNYSWGYINCLLANEKIRSEVIDLTSAFMEVLTKMNVKHTVSAGNEHGELPAFARYGSIGELVTLGLRIDRNDKFTNPDGIFHVGAMDKYAERLAEFTSKQEPLKVLEAIKVLSTQGVHVMAPWVEDSKWGLEPVNGTSFSAPHMSALIAWGTEARKLANLPELTNKEWEAVFDRSVKQFPQREPYEGGKYVDATAYLQEVLK